MCREPQRINQPIYYLSIYTADIRTYVHPRPVFNIVQTFPKQTQASRTRLPEGFNTIILRKRLQYVRNRFDNTNNNVGVASQPLHSHSTTTTPWGVVTCGCSCLSLKRGGHKTSENNNQFQCGWPQISSLLANL